MNRSNYEGRHSGESRRPARRRSRNWAKRTALILATVTLLALVIGGTVALLKTSTGSVVNEFNFTNVTTTVEEKFNGYEKTAVNVTNTGTTNAYIRVKLVTYRTNDKGDHIGGTAILPEFTLGTDWVKYGDYYYYTLPVAPGASPAANLADKITLTATYDDADGGHQSIDVMAEAIQSEPAEAVGQAWGVSISQGSVTAYTGN